MSKDISKKISKEMRKASGKADGGVGRGELFSLCLGLPLVGMAMYGEVVSGGAMFWLGALAAGVLIWGGVSLYMELFAGQSFGVAMEYAFGRAAGRILIFAMAVLWLILAVLAAIYAVLMWQALGSVGMSRSLYLLLFLLVAAIFAAVGTEGLARVALLVIVPSLLLVLGNLWLTVRGADWGNLLPREDAGLATMLGGVCSGMFLFGAGTLLLPMSERVREVKRRRGTMAVAWSMAAAVILAVTLGMRAVLSVAVSEYRFPLLQVFRLAEVGDWFSRFEVIGAGLLVAILLIGAATMMCGGVDGLCCLWQVERGRGRYVVALGAAVALWLLAVLGERWLGDWWAMLEHSRAWMGWAMLGSGVIVPWAAVIIGGLKHRKDHRTVIIRR